MILYIENPEVSKKLLELINKFNKVVEHNINIQKSVAFLYPDNELSERESKKTSLFKITSKRIGGIKLTKETKDLYAENYKTLMKEIKDDTHRWRDIPCTLIGRINIVKMTTTQSNLQIQCNPYRITDGIFFRTRTKNLTICKETQKTPNSQINLEGKKWSWRDNTP